VDYEYIDHTADIGIKAYGKDPKQVFENAAKGMFSIMFETCDQGQQTCVEVELDGGEDAQERLLVDWLNELLYLSSTKRLVFVDFSVQSLDSRHLKGKAFGSAYDPKKHRYKTEIKSATYHMLELRKEKDKYYGYVLFDI